MDASTEIRDEQAKLWNGSAGRAWVDAQKTLDQMFQPFADMLVQEVEACDARAVLDVGCGTGSTTLAIARQLGPAGRCTGLDISAPMIALARERAERKGLAASFIVADAQTHAFQPASVDMIVSRFGVMFFADAVQAFTNLRHAAKNGAALRCIAWRSAAENPFMTTAERAAAPLLPSLPVRQPGAPGQFAFADAGRVHGILAASGWADIEIRPVEAVCRIPESELNLYLTRLGPVGLMLPSADEDTRVRVIAAVRAAFEPYVHGEEVRFTAACWMISARAA
jgi:SAM-dependent methyltransferase